MKTGREQWQPLVLCLGLQDIPVADGAVSGDHRASPRQGLHLQPTFSDVDNVM